jgi:hypothetical protein
MAHVVYKVETEVEADGRWIAEIPELPGVMAYGATKKEAFASAHHLPPALLIVGGVTVCAANLVIYAGRLRRTRKKASSPRGHSLTGSKLEGSRSGAYDMGTGPRTNRECAQHSQ